MLCSSFRGWNNLLSPLLCDLVFHYLIPPHISQLYIQIFSLLDDSKSIEIKHNHIPHPTTTDRCTLKSRKNTLLTTTCNPIEIFSNSESEQLNFFNSEKKQITNVWRNVGPLLLFSRYNTEKDS